LIGRGSVDTGAAVNGGIRTRRQLRSDKWLDDCRKLLFTIWEDAELHEIPAIELGEMQRTPAAGAIAAALGDER
jgi:hypothetical protein